MKTEVKWWKVAKRVAIVVVGVCCMAALTGCGGDDDDGGSSGGSSRNLSGMWNITVTIPGEGSETIPIELPGDFSDVEDGTFTFSDGDVDITVTISGANIEWDVSMSDGTTMTMSGTIHSNTSMSGSFTMFIPGYGSVSGTWSAVKL